MDVLFDNTSFNGEYWKDKTERDFTTACKEEGKFKGPNQAKLIKEAWRQIKTFANVVVDDSIKGCCDD